MIDLAAKKLHACAEDLIGRPIQGDHWNAVAAVHKYPDHAKLDAMKLWKYHSALCVLHWAIGRKRHAAIR